MEIKIKPAKKVLGQITVPGDKSISHRAVMIGSIARGITTVKGMAESDDCNYTINAFKAMGVGISSEGNTTVIEGKGLKGLSRPSNAINVGNSGTTMRVLAGILAGQNFETTLTGDEGLQRRPMKRIVEPLSRMGVDISARKGDYPPIRIEGGIVKPIIYKTPVPSAQIKSAILFAGLYAKGTTRVIEKFKSRDHTERMLKYFGADISFNSRSVSISGGKELLARSFEIPGDISSASFFIAAAIILKGSSIKVKNVSINPTRAGILKILKKMGAKVKVVNKKDGFEPVGDIIAQYSKTRGITIDKSMIPSVIDELPIIFVLAALSKGRTVIKGSEELRVKETDRVSSMEYNLKKAGAVFNIRGNDIIIDGVDKLHGARLNSFQDHRTCMSMAVAALSADSESVIRGAESVSKSFPGFFDTLFKLTIV
ncbi:MAG: 3-phosphoshikimate 1-carboxyvinyltransferase [Candidatus Omnitrophota bacterium]|nr:3-phosphoshikimate 1-carboxyvinyltransferase [Candidatus Omnitrophota bacterium]